MQLCGACSNFALRRHRRTRRGVFARPYDFDGGFFNRARFSKDRLLRHCSCLSEFGLFRRRCARTTHLRRAARVPAKSAIFSATTFFVRWFGWQLRCLHASGYSAIPKSSGIRGSPGQKCALVGVILVLSQNPRLSQNLRLPQNPSSVGCGRSSAKPESSLNCGSPGKKYAILS